MHFKTRFDPWLVALVVAAAAAGCGGSIIVLMLAPQHGGPFWFFAPVPLALTIAALSSSLPQYYEVRAEGLLIRQGRRKAMLPYESVRAVRRFSSMLSAPVFSTHRLGIVDETGAEYVIAVADEQRFLDELMRRSPHCKRGSSHNDGHQPMDSKWIG